MKLTFSGHDSFHCRQFWLKKAYDHVSADYQFNDEATTKLGVGRNMVSALRYWAKCFDIIEDNSTPTLLGESIFQENGWDPFLEDEATLWLLHYQLITNSKASIYSLIFNKIASSRTEITPEEFIKYVNSMNEEQYNPNSLKKDFSVFTHTYHGDSKSGDIEDSFTGILSELQLVEKKTKTITNGVGKKETKIVWAIERKNRTEIPSHILLYCILNENAESSSIDFSSLYNVENSLGNIFALSKDGLTKALELMVHDLPDYNITFSNEAGIRELQFQESIDPLTVLKDYYGQ